jgi:uncharacterized protein RhaS with RHS repeats
MNGRIYDPRIGRFLSAGADTTQGWNRYSYVHNTLLNAVDPLGFDNVPVAVIVQGSRLVNPAPEVPTWTQRQLAADPPAFAVEVTASRIKGKRMHSLR